MNFQHLQLQAGEITTVTLARPDVRNAFNEEVIAELARCFAQLSADPLVRAVVLAAQGKAFCAGADLNWMKKMAGYSHAENLADSLALAQMLRSIAECSKPVIARVHGDAFAGGVGLVAACDMAFALPTARFCLSEVKLGLIPATIAPYVIRAMGQRQSQRYFLSAEVFGADEAARMGLVHAVVPDLDAAIEAICAQLLAASPAALSSCKALLREVGELPITDALVHDTAARIAQARGSADGRAGIAAFLDKQSAPWVKTLPSKV